MPQRVARMEALIGRVLIGGVMVAAALVALGGVFHLWRHGSEPANYGLFRGEPADLRTVRGVWNGVGHLSGGAIIQVGLGVLVGVQLIRVGLTVWLFKIARDPTFVAISLFILAALLYSLTTGV